MSGDEKTLDLAAVDLYLTEHLKEFSGLISATKFKTGQSNPTFLIESRTKNYVLRRKPPGVLLKSAHAVDREYRVQKALENSEVPVPKMYHFCEDIEIIGSPFYVMEHVPGKNYIEPTLDGMNIEDRPALIDEMGKVLAALHNVNVDVVGLSDFGAVGNYFERQLKRWTKQYRASETQTYAEMDELICALQSSLPADDGQIGLVHGDFRIDNLIFDTSKPQCLAVLDWELSTIGHPYVDLAGVIMQWQMPPGPEGRGLAGVDRKHIGLPSDQNFIDTYCRRRGLSGIDNFGFYLAFSFFRMASILQGVMKRALDGNASNPEHAMRLGGYVPLFARNGLNSFSK